VGGWIHPPPEFCSRWWNFHFFAFLCWFSRVFYEKFFWLARGLYSVRVLYSASKFRRKCLLMHHAREKTLKLVELFRRGPPPHEKARGVGGIHPLTSKFTLILISDELREGTKRKWQNTPVTEWHACDGENRNQHRRSWIQEIELEALASTNAKKNFHDLMSGYTKKHSWNEHKKAKKVRKKDIPLLSWNSRADTIPWGGGSPNGVT
jgi:hypothetical protein